MCIFQGSLFLTLEFVRDVTQFCGISWNLALLCLVFAGVKEKKREFQKSIPSTTPCLDFFWNSPIWLTWLLCLLWTPSWLKKPHWNVSPKFLTYLTTGIKKISKWHLLDTNKKYLNGYTKRRCAKYKLLLISS